MIEVCRRGVVEIEVAKLANINRAVGHTQRSAAVHGNIPTLHVDLRGVCIAASQRYRRVGIDVNGFKTEGVVDPSAVIIKAEGVIAYTPIKNRSTRALGRDIRSPAYRDTVISVTQRDGKAVTRPL